MAQHTSIVIVIISSNQNPSVAILFSLQISNPPQLMILSPNCPLNYPFASQIKRRVTHKESLLTIAINHSLWTVNSGGGGGGGGSGGLH